MAKRGVENKTVSMDLLESYRAALMSVRDFFNQTAKNMSSIDDVELQLKLSLGIATLGEKLGKNIESLDKLEDKVKKDEKENVHRRGNVEKALFED
jgi:hypothetical protein